MFFFYVDEAGSPEGHHEPLASGETPIFTLNSVCINENDWKAFDREYLRLKKRFYNKEIGLGVAEYYEVKGSELTRPGNRGNKRGHKFIEQVLCLCMEYSAPLFSITFIKNVSEPTSKTSLYTMALQYLCERFQAFLEERRANENGIIIIDSRMRNVDLEVAKSHLSFVFGHSTGRTCDKVLEAPMFTNSKLTAGLQVADIVGSCIFTNRYHQNCMFVEGALDYSHMAGYWSSLLDLEFNSREMYDGYPRNGFRLIDFYSRPNTIA